MTDLSDRITRVFVVLESIGFAKMRNDFESASTWQKITAGEDPMEAALKIAAQFVPSMAIAVNDLEILTPLLNIVAQVAVNGDPSLIHRCQPLPCDPVTGRSLGEIAQEAAKLITRSG
jgi:hypothetical protein